MRALIAVALCLPAAALGKVTGIATTNCDGCHGFTASPPVATVTAPAQSIAAGSTVTLTVTVSGPMANAGFFLTSNQVGTFTAASGTKLYTDGIGHSSPRAASSGLVTWQLDWTAPATPGGAEFDLAVLAGNGNGGSSGDRPGRGRLSLAWGCTPTVYRLDADGDGHGDPASDPYQRCGPSAGLAAAADDCNDAEARVFPGAIEACNGSDDNCNGSSDEGLSATTTWPDLDGDGFGDKNGVGQTGCATPKRAANDTDCDDADALAFPGATEVCNQKDDDCDLQIDEGVQIRCGKGWCGRFGPTCDPATCIPGPPMDETCNRFDDDCDGVIDNGAGCGVGSLCFEGRCYAVDVLPDAGVVDAGSAETDAGSTPDPGPPPSGCQSVPSQGGALALWLWAVARRSGPRRRSVGAGLVAVFRGAR